MKTIHYFNLKVFLFSVLLSLFTGSFVRGQDVIIKQNGDEIKAIVEQVLEMEIMYRKFENPTGPIYSIAKAEIFMIKYKNGSKDVFTTQPVPATVPPQTQQVPISKSKINDSDIQPAKTGAIINYALVAPILALATISSLSEDADASIGFGAGATVVAGIGIPIGTLISGKTRRITGVNGSLGLRIAGWSCYGLTMADAITMLALSEEVDFTGGPTISVAILGCLSTVFLALDGSKTVRDAKLLQSSISMHPTFGYTRDIAGNKYKTIGFRINF